MEPLLLILVVEDDYLIKELVQEALSEGGFEAQVVGSGEEALTLLQDKRQEYRAVQSPHRRNDQPTRWQNAL